MALAAGNINSESAFRWIQQHPSQRLTRQTPRFIAVDVAIEGRSGLLCN
jgi:hypothetical protein